MNMMSNLQRILLTGAFGAAVGAGIFVFGAAGVHQAREYIDNRVREQVSWRVTDELRRQKAEKGVFMIEKFSHITSDGKAELLGSFGRRDDVGYFFSEIRNDHSVENLRRLREQYPNAPLKNAVLAYRLMNEGTGQVWDSMLPGINMGEGSQWHDQSEMGHVETILRTIYDDFDTERLLKGEPIRK